VARNFGRKKELRAVENGMNTGAVISAVDVPGGKSDVALVWMMLLVGVGHRDCGWRASSIRKENMTRSDTVLQASTSENGNMQSN
jgi:hypothetical protein